MSRLPPLLLLALLFFAGGCETAPPKITPKGTVPVTLAVATPSHALTVPLHHLIAVTLPPTGRPGYAWQITRHDMRILKQWSELAPPASPEAPQTVSFYTRNLGTTRLQFLLLPVDQVRETRPLGQQELVVTIE